MSIEDFNNRWERFLENGNYGLDINNEKVIKFLDDFFYLAQHEPGFKYSQIKLKWGQPRFYSTLPFSIERMVENEIARILKEEEE